MDHDWLGIHIVIVSQHKDHQEDTQPGAQQQGGGAPHLDLGSIDMCRYV